MRPRLVSIFRSPFFWLFSVTAAIVMVPVGFYFGSWLEGRGGGKRESEAVLAKSAPQGVIDEETGAYRGIKWGDSVVEVKRALGEPVDDGGYYSPQVSASATWNGFNPPTCRRWKPRRGFEPAMVYREVAFNIVGGKVCSYDVAGSGWSTSGGLAAGDSVEEIEARFGEDACDEGNLTEDPFWKQWTCVGETDSGVKLKFTGNPVHAVAVVAHR